MNLLTDIPEGSLVALDTMIWIYETEGHPVFGPIVHPFFATRLGAGKNQAGSSIVTLGELLIQPLAAGDVALATRYRQQFTFAQHFTAWDIGRDVAEHAAEIRAKHNLKMVDALHVAAAVVHRADIFLTNETAFRRVTNIRVLVVSDYVSPATP